MCHLRCYIVLGENIYSSYLVGSHFDVTHRTFYILYKWQDATTADFSLFAREKKVVLVFR